MLVPACLLVALLVLTVVVRLHHVLPPNVSGDATGKWWFARKALHGHLVHRSGGGYWTHHMARASINIPAALLQLVFGPTGRSYFVPAICASLLQTGYVFALAKRLGGVLAGTLAALWIVFFPGLMQAGVQLMPGIFEAAYTVAAVYHLGVLCEERTELGKPSIVLAAFWLFGAYLAKITSVFLFPGVFIAVYWFSPRELRIRRVLWLGGLLLAAYLAETLWYAIFTQYRFGQVQITMGSYGKTGKLHPITFWQLFDRYTDLPASYELPFYAFFLSAIPILVFVRRNALRAAVLVTMSFLFGVTFYVRGINPIVQGMLNHSRYLHAVIPGIVALLVGLPFVLVQGPLERTTSRAVARARELVGRYGPAACAVFVAVLTLYYWGTNSETPGLDKTKEWEALLNRAYGSGIPIVSRRKDDRVLNAAAQSLLRDKYMFDAEGKPAQPEQPAVSVNGTSYSYLAAPGLDAAQVEQAIRDDGACIVRMTIVKGSLSVQSSNVRPGCKKTAGQRASDDSG